MAFFPQIWAQLLLDSTLVLLHVKYHLLHHCHLPHVWSQQGKHMTEYISIPLYLFVRQKVPKLASKQKHNNERAIKVASTPGQLCLLIKQGIMGLQEGSHYRPLEESSRRCLFVSQSSHSGVLDGLHMAVGHEAALIKSTPLPFLLRFILPEFSPYPNTRLKTYSSVHLYIGNSCSLNPFVGFWEILPKWFAFDSPWRALEAGAVMYTDRFSKRWTPLSLKTLHGIYLFSPTSC